jgi:hypothetical protein
MTPATVAEQLSQLAGEFKTNDPAQAAQLRQEFKVRSKNDCVRVILYLMEVVGARDAQFKNLQEENADLKEILKAHDIDLEKLADEDITPEQVGTTEEVSTKSDTKVEGEASGAAQA